MKKGNGKIKKSLKAGGLLSLVIIGAIVASIYAFSVNDAVIEQIIPERRVPTLVTGDADPGDNSGLFYFMIKNHSDDPTTEYANNLTNGTTNSNCYEWSDLGNVSATGETPYNTNFDIVLKVGITNEDGQWSHNSSWNPGYNWMLLTCANLSISADTNMSEIQIANNTNYAWYQYYLNNAGAGYTIIEGQDFNITSVKYYVQRIV